MNKLSLCIEGYGFFFFFFFFSVSTDLVQLNITGLPLRSCQDHWAIFCGGGGGGGGPPISVFGFWHQQDLNLRPGHCRRVTTALLLPTSMVEGAGEGTSNLFFPPFVQHFTSHDSTLAVLPSMCKSMAIFLVAICPLRKVITSSWEILKHF